MTRSGRGPTRLQRGLGAWSAAALLVPGLAQAQQWTWQSSASARADSNSNPALAAEPGAALLGAPDASSLADLAAGYDLVKNMLAAPVTKESLMPIILAALAPLVCVAATQAPIGEIMKVAKGFLLL